jgi:hypothetical protein
MRHKIQQHNACKAYSVSNNNGPGKFFNISADVEVVVHRQQDYGKGEEPI